jgi:LysM repeat protein
MKLIASCVLFFFAAHLGCAADAVLEFRGVMLGDGSPKLSLTDKTTDTTRWVGVGEVFIGYTVKAYDTTKETATLTKEGKEYRIRINTSKIEEAPLADAATALDPAATPAKISNETARIIFNNLKQLAAAADYFYSQTGNGVASTSDLVGPNKYLTELKPLAGEDYTGLHFSKDAKSFQLSVKTSSGETVTYDSTGDASSFYTVRPGDTIASIAKKTGAPVPQLIQLNEIDPTRLRIGDSLRTK